MLWSRLLLAVGVHLPSPSPGSHTVCGGRHNSDFHVPTAKLAWLVDALFAEARGGGVRSICCRLFIMACCTVHCAGAAVVAAPGFY